MNLRHTKKLCHFLGHPVSVNNFSQNCTAGNVAVAKKADRTANDVYGVSK